MSTGVNRHVHDLQLSCATFWVDVRRLHVDGKWLAAADTTDGPSIGWARLPEEALARALEPFAGLVDELPESVPEEFRWSRRALE